MVKGLFFLSVPVQFHRPKNQVTGNPNWGGRLRKTEELGGWKPWSSASLAGETISPLKALTEMPGQSSHLEIIS